MIHDVVMRFYSKCPFRRIAGKIKFIHTLDNTSTPSSGGHIIILFWSHFGFDFLDGFGIRHDRAAHKVPFRHRGATGSGNISLDIAIACSAAIDRQ
jgi:hypothetical protein